MRENLRPFHPVSNGREVFAEIEFESPRTLLLSFEWCGGEPVKHEALNGEAGAPQRRHELWKSTCFEAFLKPEQTARGSGAYWEINLSPLGFWNVYRFESYRQPSPPQEDPDWEVERIEASRGRLFARVKLPSGMAPVWRAGVTCVLEESSSGEKSYWSLRHEPGAAQPDFHQESGLILKRRAS